MCENIQVPGLTVLQIFSSSFSEIKLSLHISLYKQRRQFL